MGRAFCEEKIARVNRPASCEAGSPFLFREQKTPESDTRRFAFMSWRERVGIEPTGDVTRLPHGFEDRGGHQCPIRSHSFGYYLIILGRMEAEFSSIQWNGPRRHNETYPF